MGTGSILGWTNLGKLVLQWCVWKGQGYPTPEDCVGTPLVLGVTLEAELYLGEVGGSGFFLVDLSDLGCSVSWAPGVCSIFRQQSEQCLNHRLRGPVPVSSHLCLCGSHYSVSVTSSVRDEVPLGWPRMCQQLGGAVLACLLLGFSGEGCSKTFQGLWEAFQILPSI